MLCAIEQFKIVSEKIEDKIKEFEDRLAKTQVNKHTQRYINVTKSQIAKLRNQLLTIASQKSGGGGSGFGIKKSGDAQVAFIGWPSVGKSSLLNLLTHGDTHSKVAAYDFTTISAIPGMMKIEDAQIQLIDLPGIILGAAVGKGRGREVIGAARNAELVLIIICYLPDGSITFNHLDTIRKELADAGIRLNSRPARIIIKPRPRGGIGFTYIGQQDLEREDVRAIMNEFGIINASVYFAMPHVTADQLIDELTGNRKYISEFIVINKCDLAPVGSQSDEITRQIGHDRWMKVSALTEFDITALQHRIFQELHLIRVYLKPPGEEADMTTPLILHAGDTLEHLCKKLHKEFVQHYRFALIWGDSVKHPGQKFNKMDHVLADGDIVSIYLYR